VDLRHVDAVRAAQLVAENKVVILDIRTPEEFKSGHLPGARNLDFKAADFEQKVGMLHRGAVYLLHCQTGRRSTNSLETFKKLGFKSVYHLDGGYRDWVAKGNPVEK
jgi:rhodanese-related sulfurtransferase